MSEALYLGIHASKASLLGNEGTQSALESSLHRSRPLNLDTAYIPSFLEVSQLLLSYTIKSEQI